MQLGGWFGAGDVCAGSSGEPTHASATVATIAQACPITVPNIPHKREGHLDPFCAKVSASGVHPPSRAMRHLGFFQELVEQTLVVASQLRALPVAEAQMRRCRLGIAQSHVSFGEPQLVL